MGGLSGTTIRFTSSSSGFMRFTIEAHPGTSKLTDATVALILIAMGRAKRTALLRGVLVGLRKRMHALRSAFHTL
jgi:hypothetical protein